MIYFILLIMILFLSNVFLLSYLLIRKSLHQRKEIRKMKVEKQVKNLIDDLIRNKLVKIPAYYKRTPLFFEVLEETINHYLKLFSDEQTNVALKKIATNELTLLYRTRLREGSWSERMNVLYYTEDFEMTSLQEDLWNEYETKKLTEVEMFQFIRALATLHDRRLLEQIKRSPNWPYFLLKECFRRFGVTHVHALIKECFNELELEVQMALLDVVIESKDLELSYLFDELLLSESLEIRVRALKAVYVYEFTTKEKELENFKASEHWVERMFFARIAGKLKLQRYSEKVVELLSDPNWWVRQAAAEALAKYEDGLLILEYVYETSDDVFARDTAYQWLGEAVGENDTND